MDTYNGLEVYVICNDSISYAITTYVDIRYVIYNAVQSTEVRNLVMASSFVVLSLAWCNSKRKGCLSISYDCL